jgi:F0F1-type ATP synthase assembly protein I
MSIPPEQVPPERPPSGGNSPLNQAKALQENLRRAGTFAGASYSLIGAILLLGGLGYAADGWLGTEPWLLVTGLLLGVVVGFYELARVVWRNR